MSAPQSAVGTQLPTVLARGAVGVAIAGVAVALLVVVAWYHHPLAILLAVEAVTVLSLALVGASAVRSAPGNAVGWLLLASGTFTPVAIAAYLYGCAAFDGGQDLAGASLAGWLDGWPWVPAQLAVALFAPVLFPDGRLPSRRWRALIVADLALCAVLLAAILFDPHLLDWPDRANPTGLPGAAGQLAHAAVSAVALAAPLALIGAVGFETRARRLTDRAARAAVRQVRPAVWLLTLSWLSCIVLAAAGAPTIYALPLESMGLVAVGVTCWLAIRRHQLFDVRLVVRRTVVYGALSGCVLLVYVLVAAVLTQLGASHATVPVALAAAILVALPLRDRLQRAANRLVYGLRDDPVESLLALGDQLERTAALDDVLSAAASSIRGSLRLQRVVILDGETVAGEAGGSGDGVSTRVPLLFAGERLGTLVATQVEGDAPLDPERRTLLAGIARPVAAALRTIALSRDLAAAHERLISATEEERRRLQHNLHDGLGPALSSAVLGAARAHDLLVARPDAAAAQLEQLTGVLQQAVADVRHLVYDLRPAALDQLGLVGALDEHARTLGNFDVTGPAGLPHLAAATEVAAYRIALEAMTNTVRHARCSHGQVTLAFDHGLSVVVTDDGIGLGETFRAGVGITSMRKRAAQLGGTCVIERGKSGGTVVRAWLPT